MVMGLTRTVTTVGATYVSRDARGVARLTPAQRRTGKNALRGKRPLQADDF